jgi:multiple sugar transport system ATP-binding protein
MRKVSALSGGQRQRVALGRAIIERTDIILMDEPLSNLDALLRAQTRADLIKLHNNLASTIIYVTHDQIEALTLSSRIVVMSEAQIKQIGTPHQVYEDPCCLFVASFIGSPEINQFKIENSYSSLLTTKTKVSIKGTNQQISLSKASLSLLAKNNSIVSPIMAIRSEDIIIKPKRSLRSTKLLTSSLVGVIESAELLGSEYLYTAIVDDLSFKIKAPVSFEYKKGDSINFNFSSDKILFFDDSTGLRLKESYDKAIIFDLDGVILSTDEYHYQAWSSLCKKYSLNFTKEDNNLLKGVSRIDSMKIILGRIS